MDERRTPAGDAGEIGEPIDTSELLNELDELDRVASQIAVPLAHAEELYALRNNIERTRKRLLAGRQPR